MRLPYRKAHSSRPFWVGFCVGCVACVCRVSSHLQRRRRRFVWLIGRRRRDARSQAPVVLRWCGMVRVGMRCFEVSRPGDRTLNDNRLSRYRRIAREEFLHRCRPPMPIEPFVAIALAVGALSRVCYHHMAGRARAAATATTRTTRQRASATATATRAPIMATASACSVGRRQDTRTGWGRSGACDRGSGAAAGAVVPADARSSCS